jgi:hypothetical protein
MPAWLSETINDSPKVGVFIFAATPVIAVVLAAVGLLPIWALLALVSGWIGALIAVWLKRTGRLP